MAYTYDYPHYAVTADVVVFTIREEALQVLLIRRGAAPFKGRWALPGGFLRPDEDLEACARRELQEETGLSGFYLEQLYSFGAIKRDPRERVITVAWFALVRSDAVTVRAASDAAAAAWAAVDALPERFTMRELHEVYETVLGRPLDRRNFYKKMLATGELLETGESRLEGAHRPAALYRLKHPGEVRITR